MVLAVIIKTENKKAHVLIPARNSILKNNCKLVMVFFSWSVHYSE